MAKSKSTLKMVMLFAAMLAMILVIGCAGSEEKQQMSNFLKLYSDAVNEYEAADDTKRAELKAKIDNYMHQCSDKINEIAASDKVTPQTMRELEKEFKEITQKYTHLTS